jgi:transcriptional regulator of acetoin/glycerol metabolism
MLAALAYWFSFEGQSEAVIREERWSIRKTAQHFDVSKSTLHRNIHEHVI